MKIFNISGTFFLTVIVHCAIGNVTNITQHGKICGYGKNIWTVGYQDRSLQAIVHCSNCSAVEKDILAWCEGGESCTPSAMPKNVSSKWIIENETHLISELTLYDVVEPGMNFSYGFKNVIKSGFKVDPSNTIFTQYCPRVNKINIIPVNNPAPSDGSSYRDRGRFDCPKNEHLVNTTEQKLATNNTTTCGTCAKWEGMDEMECWRVPQVSVKSIPLDRSYVADDILIATEICNVIDRGKPEANPYLSWSTGNSNKTMTTVALKVEDNNKTIYCAMKNNLTDLLEEDPVSNGPLQLSIQFGPTEWSNKTSCASFDDGSNLYNATLELSFSANPIGTAEFSDKNGKPKNFTTTIGTAGCCGVLVHQYRIVLTNVPADYIIIFNYQQPGLNTTSQFDLSKSCRFPGMTTAFTTNPSEVVTTSSAKSGVDTSSAKSVDTTSEKTLDTTAKPDTLSVVSIVGIAVGSVFLIILIIIMIVLIKRRRQKGDISDPPAGSSNIQEERANPLYGTTELNSSGESKEVVENVLYGTRDATNSPADEYAEVVPKGKRKKTKTEPKDNGEVAASAEATYAVVDKKNKGKSGSDNAGYSGDPQPEETYAVVNKKGKKT